MRLTLNTLPQLAVLAKILCLLMVVMCGAVPSTVPSVSLYSTCSRGYVTVYGRTVKSTGRNEHNAPYQKLTTQSTDFSRKLYIFAEKSKRYICFNKRWKIITLPEKRRNEYCQFNETYNGRYLRYHSVVDPTRYIGFSRAGRAIAWPRGRPDCYNFLKLNPNAGVERHNSLITSAKGGGLKHPPQPPQRPAASDRDNNSRDRGTAEKLGPFGGALLGAPPRGNALRTMSNALGKINLNLVNTGPSGDGGGGGGGAGGSSKNALVGSGSSSSLGSKSLTLSSLSSSFSSSSSSPPSQQSSTSLMISSSSSASSSGSGSAGNVNVNRNNNNNRKLRQQQKQLTTSLGGQQQQRRPHRHRHGKSWDQAGTSRRRHHGRLHQQQQQQHQQQPSSSTH